MGGARVTSHHFEINCRLRGRSSCSMRGDTGMLRGANLGIERDARYDCGQSVCQLADRAADHSEAGGQSVGRRKLHPSASRPRCTEPRISTIV